MNEKVNNGPTVRDQAIKAIEEKARDRMSAASNWLVDNDAAFIKKYYISSYKNMIEYSTLRIEFCDDKEILCWASIEDKKLASFKLILDCKEVFVMWDKKTREAKLIIGEG